MNSDFNPLQSRLLFASPQRLHRLSAWNEHVPFAMMLVELQRPRVLVELGTHWGISYCAFCQAVAVSGMETRCYAVDTWAGDSHAGYYGSEIYENLKEHHQQYESFSKLMRMTFDEALPHVPDKSVDLLHIDGLHTYEAVKRDYDTWFPKMSDRGIILFHDTTVLKRGFGVHKLWAELSPNFPHFNFDHGFGLGVLAVGKAQPEAVMNFLRTANSHTSTTHELFSALGRRLQFEVQCAELSAEIKHLEQSRDYLWGRKVLAPLRRLKRLLQWITVCPRSGKNSKPHRTHCGIEAMNQKTGGDKKASLCLGSRIDSQIAGSSRPFWSVMIPIYNPSLLYLEQTLRSVLDQNIGPDEMQIEVIDDGSPGGTPIEFIRKIADERITIHSEPRNLGLAGIWNRCIERARGEWIHILHQDDYVLPDFYWKLSEVARRHPEVALISARSFRVDEESMVVNVTERLSDLENGGREVKDFFYVTPILCPGVVVKRSFYETHGGFRPDLCYALDCEMWARAIGAVGGVVIPDVLACYRVSAGNETGRLTRTAEALRDIDRLNRIFQERYPQFDFKKGKRRINDMALRQIETFMENGDVQAVQANLKYWRHNTPTKLRLRNFAGRLASTVFGY
jgi:glycosyltransferase involved in cell wall biosynthesis